MTSEGTRRRRRSAMAARLALTVLVMGLLGGCAIGGDNVSEDGSALIGDNTEVAQNALDPAPGSPAVIEDQLWDQVIPIAGAVFVLVSGLIIFAAIRFRARKTDDPDTLPKQVAGNTRLEIGWTLVPALILLVVAVPTVQKIFLLTPQYQGDVEPLNIALFGPEAADQEPLNVRVIAKQYFWEFEYEDPSSEGVVTATTLHIPTGRQVALDMQSVSPQVSYDPDVLPEGVVDPDGQVAQGVIHSFWVPELAGKQDVIPGHTREMTIATTEPGLYLGQCAEFCGLAHALMKFSVVAMEPEEFDAWIAEQAAPAEEATDGLAAEGQRVFGASCVACHAIEGYPEGGEPGADVVPIEQQARVGPNLTHFASRDFFAGYIVENNDENLRDWLRNPQAVKPGAQMPNLGLTDEQIDALVEYLRTLE